MKKIAYVLIILGVLSLIGTFVLSACSENLPAFWNRFGLIFLGYAGLALFTYGWMKAFNSKEK
ncbi:MAG: hypothetical protein GX204_03190 [Acholeplasmataceae bacterium]|jgi:hypothetical protein|nr:hypothetical protein [Acholeplasmataceae bacterium]